MTCQNVSCLRQKVLKLKYWSKTTIIISFSYYTKLYCGWGGLAESEREKDGSDVTTIALKSALSSHFPLSKFTLLMFVVLKFAIISHFLLPKYSRSSSRHSQIARQLIEEM